VTNLGGVLAQTTTSANAAGSQQLLGFADRQVPGRRLWAVEGAGSFGAGLATLLQQRGQWVVEVGRPKRPAHRSGAKSDALDAVRAAREGLAHDRVATPRRRGDRVGAAGAVDHSAQRHPCPRGRLGQLKALIVGAPRSCGQSCAANPPAAKWRPAPACGSGRPGRWSTAPPSTPCRPPPTASSSWVPRPTSSKPSWLYWSQRLPHGCWRSPASAPLSAAQVLVSWSHAGRLRSEAAFAALAGTNPIPACSGQVTRYRLNRGGDRQRNRAQAHHRAGTPAHRSRHPRLPGPPHRRGKSRPDAERCLRRIIARQLFRLLERYDRPGVEILRAT
jgi:transposase